MSKAKEILKHFKNEEYLYRETYFKLEEYDKAISELEAQEDNSCLLCTYCNKDYQLMSNPAQYELKCGIFKTVFINDFRQSCSNFNSKDT